MAQRDLRHLCSTRTQVSCGLKDPVLLQPRRRLLLPLTSDPWPPYANSICHYAARKKKKESLVSQLEMQSLGSHPGRSELTESS